MRRLSASGLRLAETCPASLHLPEIWTESGDAAEAGTARHAYLERLQTMDRDQALALVPLDAPWRSTCEGIDVSEVPRGRAEVGVALDPEDGSVHWLDAGRNRSGYGVEVPGHWIAGTLDLLVAPQQWVVDWKGPERVDDVEINLQLGAYGLIAARLHGWDWVRVSAAHVGPDGRITWRHGILDAWALVEVEERILAVVAAVRGASRSDGPYRRGVHCTRCSGLAACPAAMSLVSAVVAGGPAFDATGMLPGDLASAFEAATVVEAAMSLVKRAVEDAVWPLGTLPLPAGGSLQVVERPRKSLDPALGIPVLRELFGDAAVEAELDVRITNAGVEKLAKRVAPPRQGTAFAAELWTRLAAEGAMRSTRFQTVSLVRAKRMEKASAVVVEED